MDIQIKRIYEAASEADGKRILVDRLWSRGVSKANAHLDLWLKEIAPSTELRQWFHAATPDHWPEFKEKYLQELQTNPAVETLRNIVLQDKVTLIYSAKDPLHNHALVLQEYLQKNK